MNLIDLSHQIHNQMPVYPGSKQPVIFNTATLPENGYRETSLNFTSHIGTHIDAPAHMLENGKFLDQFSISRFSGRAAILTIPEEIKIIQVDFLESSLDKSYDIEYVLFKTGWNKYWGTEKYFQQFPVLSTEAVVYLTYLGLKGIGFDAPSADPVDSENFENHLELFKKDLIIIENLNFPDGFHQTRGEIFCFPIYYPQADGSPVRAVFKVS